VTFAPSNSWLRIPGDAQRGLADAATPPPRGAYDAEICKDAKSDVKKAKKLSLSKRTLMDLAPGGQGPKGG
jgi:hypothetical protein